MQSLHGVLYVITDKKQFVPGLELPLIQDSSHMSVHSLSLNTCKPNHVLEHAAPVITLKGWNGSCLVYALR